MVNKVCKAHIVREKVLLKMFLGSTITLHVLLYTNKLRYIERNILNKEETQSEIGCGGEKSSIRSE